MSKIRPIVAQAVRTTAMSAGVLLIASCSNVPPEAGRNTIDAASSAAALESRSLVDPGLTEFLAQNLGGKPLHWDLESLSWVAFYYRPNLEVARAEWESAKASVKTAEARPNPTLTLAPGYDTTNALPSPWFPSINLDFLLPMSGQRRMRTDASRLEAAAARLDVLSTAWQVRAEVRAALLDVSSLQERQSLLEREADLRHLLLSLVEGRLDAGALTAVDAVPARLALKRAQADLLATRQELVAARGRLAHAIGVTAPALRGVKTDEPIDEALGPELTPEQLVSARRQALEHRADILGALAHYESTQALLQLEVARRNPGIALGPGYQYDQGDNKWSLAVSFELPVFNHNEGPIAEAAALRKAAAARFTAVQSDAIAEIETASAGRAAASVRLQQARKALDEEEKAAKRMQALFDAGAVDRMELVNARLDCVATGLALLDSRLEAARAAGELESALQIPFARLDALAPSGG